VSGAVDRAALFDTAARTCTGRPDQEARWLGAPLVLLDVPLDSRMEADFARALIARAVDALVTVPDGDERTLAELAVLKPRIDHSADPAPSDSDLHHLRRFIWPRAARPRACRRRAALLGARRSARDDRGGATCSTSGLWRAVRRYVLPARRSSTGLIEHARPRRVPAYFDRGTRRPIAGRAFLRCSLVPGFVGETIHEHLSLASSLGLATTRHQAALRRPCAAT
jgi:hypothetical protein